MQKKLKTELKPKKVDGIEITSGQLLHFFQTYATIFENEDLPEPKSMLQATAEATLLSLTSDLKKDYDTDVSTKTKTNTKALSTTEFNNLISSEQALILTKFDSVKKLGDEEMIKKFRDNLLEDIKTQSDRFKEMNDNKRLAYSWKTPATLILSNIITQIVAVLLRFLFLGPIAGIFSIVTYIGWVVIGVWSYGSYTDQYSHLRERIDEFVDWLGQFLIEGGMYVGQKAMTNGDVRKFVAHVGTKMGKKKD